MKHLGRLWGYQPTVIWGSNGIFSQILLSVMKKVGRWTRTLGDVGVSSHGIQKWIHGI